MALPKFQVNDLVNKKRSTGIYLKTCPEVGTVTEIKEKFNSRKRPGYYYNVKWPDGRSSEHAQHILVPAP